MLCLVNARPLTPYQASCSKPHAASCLAASSLLCLLPLPASLQFSCTCRASLACAQLVKRSTELYWVSSGARLSVIQHSSTRHWVKAASARELLSRQGSIIPPPNHWPWRPAVRLAVQNATAALTTTKCLSQQILSLQRVSIFKLIHCTETRSFDAWLASPPLLSTWTNVLLYNSPPPQCLKGGHKTLMIPLVN